VADSDGARFLKARWIQRARHSQFNIQNAQFKHNVGRLSAVNRRDIHLVAANRVVCLHFLNFAF
jgi:hypothetical protein